MLLRLRLASGGTPTGLSAAFRTEGFSTHAMNWAASFGWLECLLISIVCPIASGSVGFALPQAGMTEIPSLNAGGFVTHGPSSHVPATSNSALPEDRKS